MGVPVTVDSDDLEALLFATGAIEKIEFALQADRIDPQAQQGRRYAEARRRANGARLNATRVADGMLKPLDQVELCEADKRFLVEFANRGTTFIEGRNYSVAAFSRIRGESLIEIANTKRAEYWTSGQELNGVMPDGRVYLALRLTERGRMWLASHPELMKQIPARQMTPEEIDAKEQRGADILNRAFEAKATVIMGSDGNRLVTAPGSVFHGNAPVDRPDETQS